MNKVLTSALLVIFLLFPSQSFSQEGQSNPLSAFKSYFKVQVGPITIPTVVEVPLQSISSDDEFLLQEKPSGAFVKHKIVQNSYIVPFQVFSSNGSVLPQLSDGRADTAFDLPIDVNLAETASTLKIASKYPLTTSNLEFILDKNSSRPNSLSIIIERPTGELEQVLNRKNISDQAKSISFPTQTANVWEVIFYHSQPLRLGEVFFDQKENAVTEPALRFLAQPNQQYDVYTDIVREVKTNMREAGNLAGVPVVVQPSALTNNPLYVSPDTDDDAILNEIDNCPDHYNIDQADHDQDGIGDACEDFDQDGVINIIDNCPDTPNRAQLDEDSDNLGDACDENESRITEKYWWIPWMTLGGAFVVVTILFSLVVFRPTARVEENEELNENETFGS